MAPGPPDLLLAPPEQDSKEGSDMATAIIATLCASPLALLAWDLVAHNERGRDRTAGPARGQEVF